MNARSFLLTLGVVLLPVTYVLTVYLDQGAWLFAGTRAAVLTAVIAFAIIAFASFLLRDHLRGALLGACVIAMLVVWQLPALTLTLGLVAIAIALDAALAGRTGRGQPRDVELLHGALGFFGLLILSVTVLQFGLRGQITGFSPSAAAAEPAPGAPDVWLVLLDGYPRADALQRNWRYDNSAFIDGLEDLGFFVADKSRSNYNSTKLTLPSMLNMASLRDMEPWSGYAKPADAPAADRVRALQHNRAFDLLREHGYRIISVGAGYTHVDVRTGDEFIDAGTADVVELHLLGDSAFGELIRVVMPGLGERQIQTRIEANLGVIDELAREDVGRPRFVFDHIPAPHPPFVFAESDRPIVPLQDIFAYSADSYGEGLLREAYRQHITHLNNLVLESLRELVAVTGDESVIIVMSDHGSRTHGHSDKLSPEDVAEQFSTLFAARTPDEASIFDDDIMTVNVLSTVFDHYLGTDLPRVTGVTESLDGTQYEGPSPLGA